MKRELDERLCKIAPHLFADRHADMRNTAMCWGFDCEDGWFALLVGTARDLEALIVRWIAIHPYPNKFPWWIFSRYNMDIVLEWRCYSFLAIWEWALIGLGLRLPAPWWPRASQIKEKYGTLRVDMTSETEEMSAIIKIAQQKSTKTCEKCGNPGKWRGKYWFYTRCAPCWKRMKGAIICS